MAFNEQTFPALECVLIGLRATIFQSIPLILLMALIFSPSAGSAEEKVTFAFFARGWPPFEMVVDGEPRGAAVDLFNALMPNNVDAVVEMMPAPRLVLKNSGKPMFVRLTARKWMGPKYNCLWSVPVVAIRTVLYSSAQKPVEYSGADSLKGLTIGCIKNYAYPEVQSLFDEQKAIRYDVNNETLLLRMVKAGRVDVAVLADVSAAWMVRGTKGLTAADFYVAKQALAFVELQFAFNLDESWQKQMPTLNDTIRKRQADGTIDGIMARYK